MKTMMMKRVLPIFAAALVLGGSLTMASARGYHHANPNPGTCINSGTCINQGTCPNNGVCVNGGTCVNNGVCTGTGSGYGHGYHRV